MQALRSLRLIAFQPKLFDVLSGFSAVNPHFLLSTLSSPLCTLSCPLKQRVDKRRYRRTGSQNNQASQEKQTNDNRHHPEFLSLSYLDQIYPKVSMMRSAARRFAKGLGCASSLFTRSCWPLRYGEKALRRSRQRTTSSLQTRSTLSVRKSNGDPP